MNENVSTANVVSHRLLEAIEQAQLNKQPIFALAAEPLPNARFPTLFAGPNNGLVGLINNPPTIRRAGFDLETGDSRIIRGDLRRALVQDWKVLELWRDGLLMYAVDAYVQPCWGKRAKGGDLRVNPLALCEPVYLFAELSRLVYEQSTVKPKSVTYQAFFKRLAEDGKLARLSEGPLHPTLFEGGPNHVAPDSEMERSIIWQRPEMDPGAIAYQLLQEIYHWFGISDDGIPYTKKTANGTIVIDPDALAKAGN